MKPNFSRVISNLLVVGALSSATYARQSPSILKVPDGTPLRLVLTESLSSATNQVDDPIYFEVTEDAKVFGVVAIPKGSTAVGHVVEVEGRKRMGRAGKLNFTVDYIKAPDGGNLRLRASSTRKGEDKTGTVIIGSVVFSPLFMIMRGKDITIPKGTQFSAYVDGDREIIGMAPSPGDPNPQYSAPTGNDQHTAAETSANGSVSFRSDPDGADITVDGKFLGTTPSTTKLTPGEHSIVIEKVHFTSWRRVMTIASGSQANVSPELQKMP
jgi:PEGA domain